MMPGNDVYVRTINELESQKADFTRQLEEQNALFEKLQDEYNKLGILKEYIGETVVLLDAGSADIDKVKSNLSGFKFSALSKRLTSADEISSKSKSISGKISDCTGEISKAMKEINTEAEAVKQVAQSLSASLNGVTSDLQSLKSVS